MNSTTFRRPRRGTALYLTVLSTALIVSLIGLAGLTIVRVERRQIDVSRDRRIARVHARSATELALRAIANNPNWRTSYSHGVETAPMSLGASSVGTLSWMLTDSDGLLTDADVNLRLKGIGRIGNTVQMNNVRITPVQKPLDSLLCSLYSVRDVYQSNVSTTNLGPFASAGKFTVAGTLYGNVEGNPVTLSGGSISGTTTSPGPIRTMPAASVWNTYVSKARVIPYESFSYSDDIVRKMYRAVLGATVNPFGLPDPDGVYLVQVPAGKTLLIDTSRIHATLLIELNANSSFQINGPCLWDPPLGWNYPAMIVKSTTTATVVLRSSSSALKEKNLPTFNANPVGEPYDGVADADMLDEYLPKCRGLFHIIGTNVTTEIDKLDVNGVLLAEGPVTLKDATVTCATSIYSDPPVGYWGTSNEMRVMRGTWSWDSAP